MNLESATCPKCGAPIIFEEGRDDVFCSHCGTQVFKDDGNKTITYRTIDEARIKEAEVKERMQKEENRQSNINFLLFLLGMIPLFLVGLYFMLR
jgi:uncharacterized Zn finger protein (UPF0148 family)